MKQELIDKIYVRTQDHEGKWGSFSLRELVEMGKGGFVVSWIMQRMCGLNEGEEISISHVEVLLTHLPENSYVRLT